MFNDARFSSREYQKWKYLGLENLFNKNKFSLKYSPEIRVEILKILSQGKKSFTTRDYWNAIGQSISLRHAERDLMACTLIRREGATKGRRFRVD